MPTLLYLVWLLWIANKHTFFGCQEISGTEDIRYIKIVLNLHCDLDLENNNLIFTQNTPAYDNVPSKFGCKKISSSADMVQTVIFDQMSPHCDPELEDSKPIFFGPWCCITIISLVTERQQLRRYHPDEHAPEFLTFSVALTLTTTEQPNLFTRQSTLWWCTIKPSVVAKGSAVQIIYS